MSDENVEEKAENVEKLDEKTTDFECLQCGKTFSLSEEELKTYFDPDFCSEDCSNDYIETIEAGDTPPDDDEEDEDLRIEDIDSDDENEDDNDDDDWDDDIEDKDDEDDED